MSALSGIDLAHPGWWALGWAVVSNLLAGGVAIYVWLSSRQAASMARLEAIETELSARLTAARSEHDPLRVNLARLEEVVRHVPNHTDLKDIYERLNPLAGEVAALRGELSGVHASLDDIKRGLSMIHESILRREEGRWA